MNKKGVISFPFFLLIAGTVIGSIISLLGVGVLSTFFKDYKIIFIIIGIIIGLNLLRKLLR